MKANCETTFSTLYHSVVLFFVLLLTLQPTTLISSVILDASNIQVSKGFPASFVLDLESYDNITILYSKIGGKADLSELSIEFIDLNLQEPEVIETISRSGTSIKVESSGKYRVDFKYTGKSRILKFRERFIQLDVAIENDGAFDLRAGETRKLFQTSSCVIGEGQENALTLHYTLTEGDRISIGCADSKSGFLKLYIPQLARLISVGGAGTIEIDRDGEFTLLFYLQEDENSRSLLNLRLADLLASDDIIFQDLNIFREKKPENILAGYSQGGGGTNDDGSSTEEDVDEAFSYEDMMTRYTEMMEEGNKDSEEFQLKQMEFQKQMFESLAEMNKPKVVYETIVIPNESFVQVEPELNFSASSGNKVCQELRLQRSDFTAWFYWIGVGKNPGQAFDLHNEEISTTFRKPLADAYAQHLYESSIGADYISPAPTFPNEHKYPDLLFEDVEYAIVDYQNKVKFERDERPFKYNQGTNRSSMITSDHGISGRPSNPDELLYLCVKNNNKATAVNVMFKYFSIIIQEKAY